MRIPEGRLVFSKNFIVKLNYKFYTFTTLHATNVLEKMAHVFFLVSKPRLKLYNSLPYFSGHIWANFSLSMYEYCSIGHNLGNLIWWKTNSPCFKVHNILESRPVRSASQSQMHHDWLEGLFCLNCRFNAVNV